MKFNIFGKFFITLTAVTLVAALLFYLLAQRTGKELLHSLSHTKARSIADVGLLTFEHNMIRAEQNEISHFLHSFASSHDASCIRILDPRGHVIVSSSANDPEDRIPIERFARSRYDSAAMYRQYGEGQEMLERHVWPVMNERECKPCHSDDPRLLGYVAVDVPLSELSSIADTHRKFNIIITITVFSGLAFSLLAALYLIVLRPVKRLQNYVTELEADIPGLHEGKPLPVLGEDRVRGNDEIAHLARSSQKLVLQLNQAYEEIFDLHEKQLERADQLASTGEMAASIAHEIKNPVSGVKAALQVFLRDMDDSNPRKEIIEEMIVQLNRIDQAVNDLLSYARMAEPQLERISLSEIIDRTLGLITAEIAHRNIRLTLQRNEGEAAIEADQQQLQQVIWNITLNAAQAMKEGGVLTVSTWEDEHRIFLEISDTGAGIPPDVLQKIYKPFFTTKAKGTGLGMTIARRIMQQHGGSIHIRSAEGQGTSVRLIFPKSSTEGG